MREDLGLYLLRTTCPEAIFTCRICGGQHRWGMWMRNEHALVAWCGYPRYMNPKWWQGAPFRPVLSTPETVLAEAEQPATDGGSGVFIRCEHPPLPGVCSGLVLYRLAHERYMAATIETEAERAGRR